MLSNILPVEAAHSSLDLFERQPLLITFDTSFQQKVGPVYAPNGPSLEFVVVGDRTNFIDLQKIFLEITCKIIKHNGTPLQYGADPADQDTPMFVNNTLHSLFSECNVTANGMKISSANGVYAHKAFIETEFSNNKEAKETWLTCQGYSYEQAPNTFTSTVFTNREQETRTSSEITLFGKLSADIFNCEKHLLSGVTLRITLIRNRPEFCLIFDDEAKDYKIEITQANLYVQKMTVTDNVYSAIEKTLTKTPAIYRYIEVIPKTFLISTGSRSWSHEDIFTREPIRRFALAMSPNANFLGAKRANPFHYQKFGLRSITVYRNGSPIAGTPLTTDNDKRLYLSSLEALAFNHHGHGIPLSDFQNHYLLVFDLTSTQQASHDYLYPELTNSSISIELKFDTAIAQNLELFFIGEKASAIYIDSARNVSKNVLMSSNTFKS